MPMSAPPAQRHAALGNQPAPAWPGTGRFIDHVQGAARPRFLSSVLVLGAAALGLAAAVAQLLAWLPPWPLP